jgi:hypothetical protein
MSVTVPWFSPDFHVSSTNKTDRHDITELSLEVALNNIKQTKPNRVVHCRETEHLFNQMHNSPL